MEKECWALWKKGSVTKKDLVGGRNEVNEQNKEVA